LIVVRPIEFYFLALIGNCVHARFIDALTEKVTLCIVAAEKAVEVVVDFAFEGCYIDAGYGEFFTQFPDFRSDLWIQTQRGRLFDRAMQFLFCLFFVCRPVSRKRLLYLREELFIEELRHFRALRAHDAIQAKVQVRFVELKEFF